MFGFVCQNCGKGTKVGEPVHLFLLWNGETVEKLTGPYDGNGAVLDANKKTVAWKVGQGRVDALEASSYSQNGIAAFHINCYRGILPEYQSKRDPDQKS